MYDVFSDLMSLYESKGIPVTKTYEEIASEALGPSLAYATPTMHGLVLTIFANDKMIAHNLIQTQLMRRLIPLSQGDLNMVPCQG